MSQKKNTQAKSGSTPVSHHVPLKYIFSAEFENNEFYEQNPQDTSRIFPPEEKKSAFSDVLELIRQGKKLVAFHLVHRTNKKDAISVSLIDGLFMINGVAFRSYEKKKIIEPPLKDYKLIYFRKWKQHISTNLLTKKKTTSTELTFRIGWEAKNQYGTNIERVLEVY